MFQRRLFYHKNGKFDKIYKMVTRRSRTKLEREAHMNIHDTVDAAKEESSAANYTRDRFGKQHKIEKDNNEQSH